MVELLVLHGMDPYLRRHFGDADVCHVYQHPERDRQGCASVRIDGIDGVGVGVFRIVVSQNMLISVRVVLAASIVIIRFPAFLDDVVSRRRPRRGSR